MATPAINPYNKYVGNNTATEFAIGFPYLDRNDVHVYLKRYDAEEEELTTADYDFISDTVIEFPKTGSSQTVLRVNDKLTIRRETPVESDYVFDNQKRLFPEDVMDADDRAFEILQEQQYDLDRAVKVSETSSVDPEELVRQVERVYASIDNIDDVADNIANIDAVADNETNINTVAGDKANIDAVAANKTNIDAVAGNATNINAVASDLTNINAVAADLTNIDNASAYANLAKDWATKTDGTVDGSEYSAKYYAEAAEDIYERIGTVIKIIGRVDTVADLPATGDTNGDCYLVGLQGATDFDEYYWLNDHWEFLGTTQVTLDFASIEGDPMDNTALANALNDKQATLVSGTNIKTVNGSTILGSGDLELSTYHPTLLSWEWSDCLKNDVQWLRADTFSWQSGAVYEAAYNHLVDDIDGKTATTETVEGVTVTYYLADDGHKIVDVANVSAVESLYAATGVAWYYVLDTVNEQFKLPRVNSDRKEALLTLHAKGNNNNIYLRAGDNTTDKPLYSYMASGASPQGSLWVNSDNTGSSIQLKLSPDSSKSGIIADTDEADTIFSGKKYLYFYVGSFTQTAIENTAGITAETLNDKMDKDAIKLVNSPVLQVDNILYLVPES